MKPPVLIAECCQNHNGSPEILERMIAAAAESGADYVKIQSISSSQLTHRERFDEGRTAADGTVEVIKRPFAPEQERLRKLDLSVDDERHFIELCKKYGVKSMTTPFTRATIPHVADLGYDAVKVASYDCGSVPFLRELTSRFHHVVVSTGATTNEEIEAAVGIMRDAGSEGHLLHCVTIYPTPRDQMHLARMMYLRMLWPQVGLSSHPRNSELGIQGDLMALALGASCIERHFTVLPEGETKDGPVSIDPEQLQALRRFADLPLEERAEKARREVPGWSDFLGTATREMSRTELLNRDYYRGRFASPDGSGGWIYNWESTPLPG